MHALRWFSVPWISSLNEKSEIEEPFFCSHPRLLPFMQTNFSSLFLSVSFFILAFRSSTSHHKLRQGQSVIEQLSDTLRDRLHLQPMSADLEGLSISLGGNESEETVDHTKGNAEAVNQASDASSPSAELMMEIREMKNMLMKEAQARQELERKLVERSGSETSSEKKALDYQHWIREKEGGMNPLSSHPSLTHTPDRPSGETGDSNGDYSSSSISSTEEDSDKPQVPMGEFEQVDDMHSKEAVDSSAARETGVSGTEHSSAPGRPALQRRPSILRRRASLRFETGKFDSFDIHTQDATDVFQCCLFVCVCI
jgi:hypothetical protein